MREPTEAFNRCEVCFGVSHKVKALGLFRRHFALPANGFMLISKVLAVLEWQVKGSSLDDCQLGIEAMVQHMSCNFTRFLVGSERSWRIAKRPENEVAKA